MKHFGYPVTMEGVAELCHPETGHVFGAPFVWGDSWGVANGFLAARVDTVLDCDRQEPEAVARVEQALPWGFHESEQAQDAEKWGELDRKRAGLWKFGQTPFWQQSQSGNWFRRTLKRVQVGASAKQVTVAGLQLVSKLPRVEVWTGHYGPEFLPFRFKGGAGFLSAFPKATQRACGFWLWQPRDELFR